MNDMKLEQSMNKMDEQNTKYIFSLLYDYFDSYRF